MRDELEKAGLEQAQLIEGKGNPLVYAEWLGAPGKPTLLFYGHYDVQPPDPLDEWKSPPFEPDDSQRQHLRARIGGRQRPDLHPDQGRGRPAEAARPACRST